MEKSTYKDNLHPECALNLIRDERAGLLVEADNLVNRALDNNLDATPFRQYRQALRDIPQTFSDVQDVVWPQKPSLPLSA